MCVVFCMCMCVCVCVQCDVTIDNTGRLFSILERKRRQVSELVIELNRMHSVIYFMGGFQLTKPGHKAFNILQLNFNELQLPTATLIGQPQVLRCKMLCKSVDIKVHGATAHVIEGIACKLPSSTLSHYTKRPWVSYLRALPLYG